MASKRNIRRKSCVGKIRYVTSLEAQHAAAAAGRRSSSWIVAYGCKFCGGHHIGHPPAHVRQAIRVRQSSAKGVG